MVLFLSLLVTFVVPPGLDQRHIPLGSPLGSMPIVVAPGESATVLQAPLTQKQWRAQQRVAIARAMRDPRAKAIARRLDQIERERAAGDGGKSETVSPH